MSPAGTNPDVDRFHRWAPAYERSALQRWYLDPVHARMLDLIAAERPGGAPGRVLDVGCGSGRLLRDLAARWPGAAPEGVDPAEGMLEVARRHQPGTPFQLGPAEALPYADGTFDGVLSSLSLHHWADARKGIAEVGRVLRPGGWFCLADHTFLWANWFGEKVKSARELQDLMAFAGLEVRRREGMGLRFVTVTWAEKTT